MNLDVIFQPAINAAALLSAFEAMGLDAEAMAKEAGVAGMDLRAPQAELPVTVFVALWGGAMRRAPREELLTEVGFAVPFGAFGLVDYLAGSSETMEAGLFALRDHFRAIAFGIELDLISDARGAWLRVLTASTALVEPRLVQAAEEFTLAVTLGRIRTCVEGGVAVDAIELSRPAPAQPARYAELFQAPVTFGHTHTGAHVLRETLQARMRTTDPGLQRTLSEVAKQLGIAGDNAPVIEMAVRSRLRSLLPKGKPAAADIARTLGLSERSFHRRLAELGSSYQDLVDRFRAAEAERLLSEGRRSSSEIALTLGFADQTAFIRAFRRWKGTTPGEWALQRESVRKG